MATPKRERKRVSKQVRNERQASARQRATARRQRRVGFVSILLVVIIGVFGVLSATNSGNRDPKDQSAARSKPTVAQGQTSCPAADGSSPRQIFFEREPGRCIDATKRYEAVMKTTAGTMHFELRPGRAFKAVNNFVFLARYHFYDGLDFHRVLKDAFIQTGEPTAKGVTGPGYFFRDDGLPLSGSDYVPGALLFAHERPNENGSQILIVSGAQGATLEPVFPLFGKLSRGMEVLERINATGTSDIGKPSTRYRVIGIEVSELRST